MTVQNKRILASILFVLICFVCVAQGPPPPAPPAHGLPLPIDGGVFFGVIFALFYGVRKLMINYKK